MTYWFGKVSHNIVVTCSPQVEVDDVVKGVPKSGY
jgi:hypothetical protein